MSESVGMNRHERLPIAGWGAPPWKQHRRWKCFPNLKGGSTKKDGEQELKRDATDTINSWHSDKQYIIYTGGSAREGLYDGGSAAVVTMGPPSDPNVMQVLNRKGRKVTCSYETELGSLDMAAGYG